MFYVSFSRGIILSNGALCYGNWALLETIITFESLLENTCQIVSFKIGFHLRSPKECMKIESGKGTFWVLKTGLIWMDLNVNIKD